MSGFSSARQKMVDGQVRTNDVTDLRIIDAMVELPREVFVPEDKQALAYLDRDLDVSSGGTKRFLIKPMLTAKLLQAALIAQTDNVLIVGCATGYAAALAAKLAGKVTATESDPELVRTGTEILNRLGLGGHVTLRVAEAATGAPADAPFDVIMLNGATGIIPEQLYGQLKEGGRLVGVSAMSRPSRAMLVTHSHHDFGNRALFDAAAPVLPGLEQRPAFVF